MQRSRKSIGDKVLAPLECQTLLFEAQTYSTNAQLVVFLMILKTAPYLCPNDILLGRASTNTPQGPFRETKNPRHRYEFCQRIVDNFWKRWYQDVFPSVVPRRKWHTKCRNVQVDDIVVVADQNARGGKILVYFLGPPKGNKKISVIYQVNQYLDTVTV